MKNSILSKSLMLFAFAILASSVSQANCANGEVMPGRKINRLVEVRANKKDTFIHEVLTKESTPDKSPLIFQADGGVIISSLNWKSVYLLDYFQFEGDSKTRLTEMVKVGRETLDAIGCEKVALPDWYRVD